MFQRYQSSETNKTHLLKLFEGPLWRPYSSSVRLFCLYHWNMSCLSYYARKLMTKTACSNAAFSKTSSVLSLMYRRYFSKEKNRFLDHIKVQLQNIYKGRSTNHKQDYLCINKEQPFKCYYKDWLVYFLSFCLTRWLFEGIGFPYHMININYRLR